MSIVSEKDFETHCKERTAYVTLDINMLVVLPGVARTVMPVKRLLPRDGGDAKDVS